MNTPSTGKILVSPVLRSSNTNLSTFFSPSMAFTTWLHRNLILGLEKALC